MASPHLAQRNAIEHLGDAGAGGTAGVLRQRVDGEKSVVDDFAIRDGRCVLRKVAHDEQSDMIAARDAMVEKHAVQHKVSPVSTPPPGRCQPET